MSRQAFHVGEVNRKHVHDGVPGGFTLIELLVVVAIIAVVSAIILPVFFQAADRARKASAQQTALQPESLQGEEGKQELPVAEPAFPPGPRPVLDSVALKMTLTSSYHRIGMDVFTRYRVDCTGQIVFQRPEGIQNSQVALIVPFPANTLEARDVEMKVFRPGSETPLPLSKVIYSRKGIYCLCPPESPEPLTAEVRFTALGREQFDYPLPPAQQLKSVALTLNLSGMEAYTLPDDSLQPSFASPHQLRWEFQNLVSDRQITVQIPGAEAPLARVMLLSRLVALAVLLFGAGFWYLSEQVQPGRMDSFRLGHFLLLALTYSLFFIIFAVLGFHGKLETPIAMALSAVFSLPLLILHTARILDLRFALTRVVPLAVFTVGLVVTGVYGAEIRDYVFIGAAILGLAYVTLTYQSWTAGRERYRQRAEITHTARCIALIERITTTIGAQMAALNGDEARAEELLQATPEADPTARFRLESAGKAIKGLSKEYEELTKHLSYLPSRPGWDAATSCKDLERKAQAFQDRMDPYLTNLQAELALYQQSVQALTSANSSPSLPVHEGEFHCLSCGKAVPEAPFCQQCGTAHPNIMVCAECGDRIVVPTHLLAAKKRAGKLFCIRCGAHLSALA